MKKNSKEYSVLIIAEIGINHEGDVNVAKRMIREAAKAGANAIKLQTIDPDENYLKNTLSHKIFRNARLTKKETGSLFKIAKKLGVDPFTTAGDFKTIDWVNELNPSAFKISSSLLTCLPIIKYIAKKKRHILMSTGMANMKEIKLAIETAKKANAKSISLLHCTSLYPTPTNRLNLATISLLREKFNLQVGYSDHSLGSDVAKLAVAAGARIVEKHFTLDSKRKGFDHAISLEPPAFKKMVNEIRTMEKMLGKKEKIISREEKQKIPSLRRYLVVKNDIKKGEKFTKDNLGFCRIQGNKNSLEPKYFESILGRRAKKKIFSQTPLKNKHFK
mgnify:FL=1